MGHEWRHGCTTFCIFIFLKPVFLISAISDATYVVIQEMISVMATIAQNVDWFCHIHSKNNMPTQHRNHLIRLARKLVAFYGQSLQCHFLKFGYGVFTNLIRPRTKGVQPLITGRNRSQRTNCRHEVLELRHREHRLGVSVPSASLRYQCRSIPCFKAHCSRSDDVRRRRFNNLLTANFRCIRTARPNCGTKKAVDAFNLQAIGSA